MPQKLFRPTFPHVFGSPVPWADLRGPSRNRCSGRFKPTSTLVSSVNVLDLFLFFIPTLASSSVFIDNPLGLHSGRGGLLIRGSKDTFLAFDRYVCKPRFQRILEQTTRAPIPPLSKAAHRKLLPPIPDSQLWQRWVVCPPPPFTKGQGGHFFTPFPPPLKEYTDLWAQWFFAFVPCETLFF